MPIGKRSYLAVLKTFFKFALRRKCARTNPALDIRLPRPRETTIEIFTVEELKALLNAAPQRIIPFMAIGAFAGLRTAELLRMKWSNVKLDQGIIEVTADMAKTRQRRIIPISGNLKAWLESFAEQEGPIVGTMNESGVHDALHEAADKAGVKWKSNALRHSYASYREAQIKNVNQVASEMGNSAGMVFKHYRAVVGPREAEAWWGIWLKKPDIAVELAAAA